MKVENVQKRYVSYTITFQQLHIPFLALAQLYAAYWRVYVQSTVNYRLGMPKTFLNGVFHLVVALIFLFLSVVSRQSFKVTIRSVPFIIICGIVHVSVASNLFSRAQFENGPFISACYQPFAPALASCIAFFMGYEKPTKLKITGLAICFFAVISRLMYDLSSEVYEDSSQFRGKFFIFQNIMFYAVGVLIQKKIVAANPRTSLLVICFYIFLFASIASMMAYHLQFANFYNSGIDTYSLNRESFDSYFSAQYLETMRNIVTLYSMYIVTEVYKYIALIYINKMGYISKVTMYSALHGFFVIIIIMVFQGASNFDFVFASMVTVAYLCVYSSKFFHSRATKKNYSGKILRFRRKIKQAEEVSLYQSVSEMSIRKTYFSTFLGDSNGGSMSSSDHLSGFGAQNGTPEMLVLKFSNSRKSSKTPESLVRLQMEAGDDYSNMISSPEKAIKGNKRVESPKRKIDQQLGFDLIKSQKSSEILNNSNAVRLCKSINCISEDSSEDP